METIMEDAVTVEDSKVATLCCSNRGYHSYMECSYGKLNTLQCLRVHTMPGDNCYTVVSCIKRTIWHL